MRRGHSAGMLMLFLVSPSTVRQAPHPQCVLHGRVWPHLTQRSRCRQRATGCALLRHVTRFECASYSVRSTARKPAAHAAPVQVCMVGAPAAEHHFDQGQAPMRRSVSTVLRSHAISVMKTPCTAVCSRPGLGIWTKPKSVASLRIPRASAEGVSSTAASSPCSFPCFAGARATASLLLAERSRPSRPYATPVGTGVASRSVDHATHANCRGRDRFVGSDFAQCL